MKFVYSLSKDEEKKLNKLIRSSSTHRTRQRAHAIMLSAKKYPIDSIAVIFDVHRDTVSRWIDVWVEKGIHGLFDAPKPGRPRITDADDIYSRNFTSSFSLYQ